MRDVVREKTFDEDGRVIEKGIELGAKNYDVNSYLDGEPSVKLGVFQLPGSNGVDTAEAIREKMSELESRFPKGVEYRIEYDTTTILNTNISNVAGMFVILEPFEERAGKPELAAPAVIQRLRQKFSEFQEAQIAVFGAPPVEGLGSTGGF